MPTDPTNMHLTLAETLADLTRAPHPVEMALVKQSLEKWFGSKSVAHSLFPGPAAVGIEKKHAGVVNCGSHFVTFKVDGIAQMLLAPRLIDGRFLETVFFIDRRGTVRALDGMRFEFDGGRGPILLDGELVFRRRVYSEHQFANARQATFAGYAESFQHRTTLSVDRETFSLESHDLCFVVADCPVSPRSQPSNPLATRLQAARFMIEGMLPIHTNPADADKMPPIVCKTDAARKVLVLYKPHQHGVHFEMLLSDVFPILVGMPIDGFILTPTADAYTPGNNYNLLKVKPVGRYELDPVVQQLEPGRYAMFFAGPQRTLVRWRFNDLHCNQVFAPNTIVEVCYSGNQFHFVRERRDKSHPNSIRNAIATVKAARDPVRYAEVAAWLKRTV